VFLLLISMVVGCMVAFLQPYVDKIRRISGDKLFYVLFLFFFQLSATFTVDETATLGGTPSVMKFMKREQSWLIKSIYCVLRDLVMLRRHDCVVTGLNQ